MNHYCTYFDRGFLPQGLALWESLRQHDSSAVLWVLALDAETKLALSHVPSDALRVVPLLSLEADDSALGVAKANRSRVEYYFTLTPCWLSWLLAHHPEIRLLTYLDADLFFFGSPLPLFSALESSFANVLITSHRLPRGLLHYERHGRYNVGVLSFRNDPTARACLDDWRARCLEWCYDRLEDGKYADQKYLDAWPERLGNGLLVLDHPGVNLAPWNWVGHTLSVDNGRVTVDGEPLIIFHFAGLRRLGNALWNSGQLDYGVMPRPIRTAIYGPYLSAVQRAEAQLQITSLSRRKANISLVRWLFLIVFGAVWLRSGKELRALGGGPWSKYSGSLLARIRGDSAPP
jgi:hypothetical protein